MATRRERVVLDLEDNLSAGLLRSAAAAELLNSRVNSLSKGAVESRRATRDMGAGVEDLGRKSQRTGNDIDKLSGRMRILADVAAVLGPALIPIGALAAPAVAGLAAQFGFAALGAGVAIGAFQGVGDALKAMNKAQLEPTTENLRAAKAAMQEISPAARHFVRHLQAMGPELKNLRDIGAAGMFPGLAEGLDGLEGAMPRVQKIMKAVSEELGAIGADAGQSLGGERWAPFLDFLGTDAPSALADMATAAGNTGHAMAELWMAFDPVNDDFSTWMVDATASLDQWAAGLAKTDGFAEFVQYIEDTGPQVGETLGAIANAMLQIVEAAAPIAGPVLEGVEAFANLFAKIADSDLGTPIFGAVAALSAMNLAMRTTASLQKATFGGPAIAGIRQQLSGFKSLAAASREVKLAEQSRAQATMAARDAQFALISPQAKRGAVADAAAATRRVTEAEKARTAILREGAATVGKSAAAVAGLTIATTGLGESMGVTNTASLGLTGTMAGPLGVALGTSVGLVLDLSHRFDDLNAAIDASGQAARTGDIDAMTAAYARLNAELKKSQETKPQDYLPPVSAIGIANSAIKKLQSNKNQAALATAAGGFNGAAAFGAAQQVAASSAAAARGFDITGAAAKQAGMSVSQFTAAMKAASDAMNNISSQDALRSALLDARDLVKESGKVLNANGDALKAHARAGIAARASLVNIGSSAQKAGEQMKAGFGKTKFLDDARRDFVRLAQSMGMSRPAARKMAEDFGLIDRLRAKPKVQEVGALESRARVKAMRTEIAAIKSKMVKMDEKGAAAARSRIAALRAAIDALRSKTVNITTVYTKRNSTSGRGPAGVTSAYGNVLHFAQGDVANRHMPELAGPGPTRVWREPETQGEAYIPLANDDRRPRARDIAEETIGLLGGDPDSIEWHARGGHHKGRGKHHGGGGNNDTLKRFKTALEKSTNAIEAERSARDDLVSRRNELASNVSGKFTSDIFGESNVWAAGGGAGGVAGILKADIAKANAFKGLLSSLKQRGLDGGLLAELASTGDVGRAQGFASMSNADLATNESLFNQRAAAASAVGSYAGSAVYGADIAGQNQLLAASLATQKKQQAAITRLEKELKKQPAKNGHAVGKGVNKAASTAKRKNRRHG